MKRIIVSIALFAVLVIPVGLASPASAQSTFAFLVAVSPLCGFFDPATDCPAISMADNGDLVKVTGSGTVSTHPKSAAGSGTFEHWSGGALVASGEWTVTGLISFKLYGSVTPPGSPTLFGGKALLRVLLDPGGDEVGPMFPASLLVLCAIGNPPGHQEGIRLNVQDALNFNKEVQGLTVFLDS